MKRSLFHTKDDHTRWLVSPHRTFSCRQQRGPPSPAQSSSETCSPALQKRLLRTRCSRFHKAPPRPAFPLL